MSAAAHFLLGAMRAIVEMLGLCLIGQGALALLAGRSRHSNPIYRLFALITRQPRALLAIWLPKNCSENVIGVLCFLSLFLLWLGLAFVRKFI